MERLPYIDEHVTSVGASPQRAYDAVLAHSRTLVGRFFTIEEAAEPRHLALVGSHPFSRYRLRFDVEDTGDGRATVRARTWAAFPGPHGQAYRALVIRSGGHRFAVRRMLRAIAGQA